jgi:hypothetical protein
VKAQVADEDIDAFIEQWVPKLNPALSQEDRAEAIRVFAVGWLRITQPDKSDEWVSEFGRRVRDKVQWRRA